MDTFSVAMSKLVLDQPFFGTLALYLTPVSDEKIITAGTDGIRLIYNPGWLEEIKEKYGIPAVATMIAHEVLHCALGHIWRGSGRNKKLWNFAADYAANLILYSSGFKLPDEALLNHSYENMPAEEIYNRLLLSKSVVFHKILLDDHELWDDAQGAANEDLDKRWKAYIASAAQAAREAGGLPGSVERLVDSILAPQISYKQILAEYMERLNREYSWGPFDRRSIYAGRYLPSTGQDGLNEIVIAVDTSGSISEKEISQFLAEVCSIASTGPNTLYVAFCDAAIKDWYTVQCGEDLPKVKIRGGGGTDFVPVFKEVEKQGIEPAVLIYLTDGYGNYPEKKPDYPVLWVVTKDHENPPWGRVVELN